MGIYACETVSDIDVGEKGSKAENLIRQIQTIPEIIPFFTGVCTQPPLPPLCTTNSTQAHKEWFKKTKMP